MSERRRKLRITGAHAVATITNVKVEDVMDEVSIIVTQLFGPKGDNLVGVSDVTFDGYPAFTLLVKAAGSEGMVHLSPIQGDDRKVGMEDLAPGTKCELFCPVSGAPLDKLLDVPENLDTDYFSLYLTPELTTASSISISNEWNHYHSRVVDNNDLISSWEHESDNEDS